MGGVNFGSQGLLCCTPIFSFNSQSDPKRVKKDLPKVLKTLKPGERVMIIGVSKQPYDILFLRIKSSKLIKIITWFFS